MSEYSDLANKVAQLTQRLNDITVQARKIPELPEQNPLVPSSLLHASNNGTSQKIVVQQILDAALSYRQNQLLSIGTISVDGNNVTVPAGATWVINNIDYSNPANIVINIPYAADGFTRTDIIVADQFNNMYRVNGPETEGVSPTPNTPLNTVLITIVTVTDSTVGNTTPIPGDVSLAEKLDRGGYIGTAQDIVNLIIPEAPIDNTQYGRKNGTWSEIEIPDNEITVTNSTRFEAFGDSITVGLNSSPDSNSYINLLTSLYGKPLTNRAVSGEGVWRSTKLHLANISPSSNSLSVVMSGFNDVRRGGSATKTIKKIINSYNSILANQFLDSFIAANPTDSRIFKSGSWTGYAGSSLAGAKTNDCSYTVTATDYIEYSFSNNNVVIGLIGGDGVSEIYADFTVTIDGLFSGNYSENNQTDGITDGSNSNTRQPMCLYFNNLSDGPHVVRITSLTSDPFLVDYFGHLKKPKFCSPILIMHAPKMDATGYAIVPNLANDTVINQLNSIIDNVIVAFSGYPIFTGKTEDYYNISTGLDLTDHIHPNNIGHRQIYSAAYNALTALVFSSSVGDASTTVKGIIKLAGDIAGTADLPTVPGLATKLNVGANPSLAGSGIRMVETLPDGTPIATYNKYQMKVSDTDVISAITSATYIAGIATITPSSSKIMREGQVYQAGTYLYRAYSDNLVLRTILT